LVRLDQAKAINRPQAKWRDGWHTVVQDRFGARLSEAKLPSLHDCRSRRPGRCPKDLVPWSSLLHSFIFPSSIFSSIHLTSDTCIKYHHALDASRYAIGPRQICLKDGVTMRHESVHFYRHPGPRHAGTRLCNVQGPLASRLIYCRTPNGSYVSKR
jgi:hypothetical protein